MLQSTNDFNAIKSQSFIKKASITSFEEVLNKVREIFHFETRIESMTLEPEENSSEEIISLPADKRHDSMASSPLICTDT